jgi:hypothetical protein
MPLYNKKPVELIPPPDDLRKGEEVFVIRFTGEVFREYQYAH